MESDGENDHKAWLYRRSGRVSFPRNPKESANPRLPRYRGDENRWTLFGRTFVAVPCPPEIQTLACNLDQPGLAVMAEIQKKCAGCVFEEDQKWCFFTPPCYKDSRDDGLHVRFREETPEEGASGELVF